jgi:hypothetical protein
MPEPVTGLSRRERALMIQQRQLDAEPLIRPALRVVPHRPVTPPTTVAQASAIITLLALRGGLTPEREQTARRLAVLHCRQPAAFRTCETAIGPKHMAIVVAVMIQGESLTAFANRIGVWPYAARWQFRTALDLAADHLADVREANRAAVG